MDEVHFSPKVAQEMLDIEILELCKASNFDEALKVLGSASSRGQWPSDVVALMFAKSLVDLKDVARLEALEHSLPCESPVADKVYEQVFKLKLLANYDTYKEGHKSLALEDLMAIYQKAWEDEVMVSYEALESSLAKARRLTKLYAESFVGSGNTDALAVLKEFGRNFGDQFDDYRWGG